MDGFESRTHNRHSWAPPRTGVTVERRDLWELVSHGTLAGLLAGLGLGFAAVVASTALRDDPVEWIASRAHSLPLHRPEPNPRRTDRREHRIRSTRKGISPWQALMMRLRRR